MSVAALNVPRDQEREWPAVAAWAESGLMALSGARTGAPAIPAFDARASIDLMFQSVESRSASLAQRVQCDIRLLTERAALQRFTRQGRISCNTSCRLIEARDGWVAINLARAVDIESVPAFTGCSEHAEPWAAVARAARGADVSDLVERGQLLGMAVAEVGMSYPRVAESGVQAVDMRWIGSRRRGARNWWTHPPLVIDLSALWAGPLCGELLAEAGARVIKVECIRRPDTIRQSSPALFDLLNAHKESLALDFTSELDRARLRTLVARADVVIASARPRAFERLDLEPESIVAGRAGLTWVAVTAYGWSGPRRNWVGFGDDAAAAGGLLTFAADGSPMFAGDALADPLTGINAAAGALTGIALGGGVIVDASLVATAAFVAGGPRIREDESRRVLCERGSWLVSMDEHSAAVRPPRARSSDARAPALGADNRRVLRQLLN